MNNSNRFIEISVKQQLALCHIANDLIEMDIEIDKSFNKRKDKDVSNLGSKLITLFIKILPLIG